jgi:hypothetical protein
VADNATWFQPTNRPRLSPFPGGMSVVEAQPGGLVLAMNQIEKIHGGFTFDGDRLYVRSQSSLMCFAHTGEAGKVFEAETVAAQVLRQVYPYRPSATEPISVPVRAEETKGLPALRLNSMIWHWQAGEKMLHTKNALEWAEDGRLDAKGVAGSPHIGLGEVMGQGIDLAKLGSVRTLQTTLRNEYQVTVHLDSGHPQAKATLNGVPIPIGQAVVLPEGTVTLAIELPAGATGIVRPRFWPNQDAAAWQVRVEQCRPYLERVVALAPGSAVSSQAKALLSLRAK